MCVKYLFLCEQAYFAKYDAVALYLSRRKYPPGLTYVEKNTFRRFCKKFAIKGLQRDKSLLLTGRERVTSSGCSEWTSIQSDLIDCDCEVTSCERGTKFC